MVRPAGVTAHDYCTYAVELVDRDGDLRIVEPFDLAGATFACQDLPCNQKLQNDLWYHVVAPVNGEMTVSTCGTSPETSPDTELMVYVGCECPPSRISPPECAGTTNNPNCLASATSGPSDVAEGQCYTIRLGDNQGGGGRGDLTVQFEFVPHCPVQTIEWLDPLDGTVDARTPTGTPPGETPIGVDAITVSAPQGADVECWSLCETSEHPGLHPNYPPELSNNGIAEVVDHGDGTLTLGLKRPITPGEMSALTYTDKFSGKSTGRLSALPADVSGDGAANASDVLVLIEVLNGTAQPAWGPLSGDCDHDGVIGAADVLCVIDLLNAGFNGITIGGTINECP